MPIAIVDATDVQSLEFAIIENVQRADLNPIEEAAGYVALMEQCNHTQEQVAQIVGKSRPYVANMVRLLKLPEPVKTLVRAGQAVGRPRAAAGRPCQCAGARRDGDRRGLQRAPARGVGARGRRARPGDADMARHAEEDRAADAGAGKDADTRALERRLSDALGLEVSIDHKGEKGTLTIKYTDLDQLDAVLRKLGG